MRIIAGKYKGRHLFFQKEQWRRPTQDKVKESLFNILQNDIEGATFLDLFCGTGGIGMEALSRHAKSVTFVDRNTEVAKKNLSLLKDAENYQVYRSDIKNFFKKNTLKFFIIFLDPPWSLSQDDIWTTPRTHRNELAPKNNTENLFSFTLNAIIEFAILAKHGILICEHQKKLDIAKFFPVVSPVQYFYSDTVLSIFRT